MENSSVVRFHDADPPDARPHFDVDNFPMLNAMKKRYESLSSNIGLPNLPLPSVTSVASVVTESHSPPSGDY